MLWELIIGGIVVIVVLIILFFIWAVKSSKRQIMEEIRKITVDEIDNLVAECVSVFRDKMGIILEIDKLKACTFIFDESIHISNKSLVRKAFEGKGLPLHFIKPVGAFLGELICTHMNGRWQKQEDGVLSVRIEIDGEEKTIEPYEMVRKQEISHKSKVFSDLFEKIQTEEDLEQEQKAEQQGDTDHNDSEKTAAAIKQKETDQEKETLEKQIESGANWFFAIAALSLLNSVMFLAGIDGAFFFGLGITQVIDGIMMEIGGEENLKAKVIAFALDLIVAALFVLLGVLAKKRFRRAFLIGTILYSLDALIFLLVQDFLGIIVHIVALCGMFKGLKAVFSLKRKPPNIPVLPDVSLQSQSISLTPQTDEKTKTKEVIWPFVISIISFIYLVLFALLTIRNLSSWWKITGTLFLLGGVVGIWFRRKRGMYFALIGAIINLSWLCYRAFVGYHNLSKSTSMPTVIVILTIFLILMVWPTFLLIWFSRKKVREHIDKEWHPLND
jgi:hypothetical protein